MRAIGKQKFVQWQIDEGTDVVVPCGTTGESPTLSHDEDMRVTRLCVEVAKGQVPVIAGTGSKIARAIDRTESVIVKLIDRTESVIAKAIERSDLHRRLAVVLLGFAGNSPRRITIRIGL